MIARWKQNACVVNMFAISKCSYSSGSSHKATKVGNHFVALAFVVSDLSISCPANVAAAGSKKNLSIAVSAQFCQCGHEFGTLLFACFYGVSDGQYICSEREGKVQGIFLAFTIWLNRSVKTF